MPMMRSLSTTILELAHEAKILTEQTLPDILRKAGLAIRYDKITEKLKRDHPLIKAINLALSDQEMNDLALVIKGLF